MTQQSKSSTVDPELSARIQAVSQQGRALGNDWNQVQVRALYDECDVLSERTQAAGLSDLSETLLGLAAYLSSFADSSMRPNDAQIAQLHALADAAADALERYRAHIRVAVLAPDRPAPVPLQPAIHYLGQNPSHADLLHTRFVPLGYAVTSCAKVRDVERALDAETVLALVVSAEALPHWLAEHRTDSVGVASAGVPLVVLSDEDDIDMRLAAMRSAAEAVFVLPEDENRIVSRLSGLIADRSEPYRVLIVDDDRSMRLFCDSVLRHNNLETHAVATPAEALQALRAFTPDVILADLYMPDISGFELLSLFRAHPRTAFTPVVLLSGDSDMEKRFAALHIGGDDYLTKPIHPRHLVAAVISRARRARWMRRELFSSLR